MNETTSPAVPVTVLIPVYNAAHYLLDALHSVSQQSYRDFEILVIDDGSTDASPQLLAQYGLAEPRLRVLRQANGGISAALNVGLAQAKGEYIVRMDADDLMLPQRIELQLAFLRAHPELGFCASAMYLINSRGQAFGTHHPRPRSLDELRRMMDARLPITYTHPTVTCRTAALRAVGGYDRSFEPCEDMELFGRLIRSGQPGLVLPEPLLRYRVHGASISGLRLAQQVRTQEFVRAAFYAALQGQTLDQRSHEASLQVQPWLPRQRARLQLLAEVQRRHALYHHAAGRPLRACACTLLSACLRPAAACRALWRRLTPDKSAGAQHPRSA